MSTTQHPAREAGQRWRLQNAPYDRSFTLLERDADGHGWRTDDDIGRCDDLAWERPQQFTMTLLSSVAAPDKPDEARCGSCHTLRPWGQADCRECRGYAAGRLAGASSMRERALHEAMAKYGHWSKRADREKDPDKRGQLMAVVHGCESIADAIAAIDPGDT